MMHLRTIAATFVVLALFGGAARAQYTYPPGYGGYGWNGWGSSTPAGNMAQGMGAFAAGAGAYRQQAANANAINARTLGQWNEYIYQSQQVRNRQYQETLAKRRQANIKTRRDAYLQLRNNPTPADISSGDALNSALDEVSNPKVSLNDLEGARTKVEGATIRDIPFRYASEAITISVYDLTRGGPPAVLKGDAFSTEREALKKTVAELRRQQEEREELNPETIKQAQAQIKAIWAKIDATLPKGSAERRDAEKYIKAAYGLSRMLETPAINVLLAGVEKRPDTTLGDLLSFMKAFNLRFGAAKTPRQRVIYGELYPLLVRLRDQAAPRVGDPLASTEPQPDRPHTGPTEFFNGMDFKDLDASRVPPPAPRPPAPPG